MEEDYLTKKRVAAIMHVTPDMVPQIFGAGALTRVNARTPVGYQMAVPASIVAKVVRETAGLTIDEAPARLFSPHIDRLALNNLLSQYAPNATAKERKDWGNNKHQSLMRRAGFVWPNCKRWTYDRRRLGEIIAQWAKTEGDNRARGQLMRQDRDHRPAAIPAGEAPRVLALPPFPPAQGRIALSLEISNAIRARAAREGIDPGALANELCIWGGFFREKK